MNVKKAGVVITLTILVSVSIIPLCGANASHDSDEYYFEDVNVLIIGRCRTIGSDGSWKIPIHIGFSLGIAVQVGYDQFERINVKVYNESISHPLTSFSNLVGSTVVGNNVTGIFFWSCLRQHNARLIPPIVFVWCHADKVWIN